MNKTEDGRAIRYTPAGFNASRFPVAIEPLLETWSIMWDGWDGHQSGVIADWCEDHWELMLTTMGEGDARQFVDFMRARFHNPGHNRVELDYS